MRAEGTGSATAAGVPLARTDIRPVPGAARDRLSVASGRPGSGRAAYHTHSRLLANDHKGDPHDLARSNALAGALGATLVDALALTACDDNANSTKTTASTTTSTSSSPARSEEEFVAAADQICVDSAPRFTALKTSDSEGGALPVGLGPVMRELVVELRTLAPPAALADDWTAALDLLNQSADKIDEAENGSDDAQSEALYDLQPRAQEHIDAMGLQFDACFTESDG